MRNRRSRSYTCRGIDRREQTALGISGGDHAHQPSAQKAGNSPEKMADCKDEVSSCCNRYALSRSSTCFSCSTFSKEFLSSSNRA